MLEGLVWFAAAIADIVFGLKGPHHEPPRDDMRVLGDIVPGRAPEGRCGE